MDVVIKSMTKHEQYDPNAYTNDIGLLVLEWDVQFTGKGHKTHDENLLACLFVEF